MRALFIGSHQKQRGGDATFFLHQDVVSPAGRAEIHRLQSNPARGEQAPYSRRRKALLAAGAQQNELGLQIEEGLQLFEREQVRIARLPIGDQRLRRHDAVGVKRLIVNTNFAGSIAADEIDPRLGIERELHGRYDTPRCVSF